LALSLLVIVGKCHEANYLHNDITPSNVLLHFDDWVPDTVYIGLCDWGLSGRVVEQAPSKYGFPNEEELVEQRAKRKWVAPELWFVFGPRGSDNAIDIMESRHLLSKAADAFSTGWLAECIWEEELNMKYFMPHRQERAMNHQYLKYKLQGLQDPNPTTRLTVPDVIEALEKHPFNWAMPSCCFRNSAV
jgi:serine/threonine protein kinase